MWFSTTYRGIRQGVTLRPWGKNHPSRLSICFCPYYNKAFTLTPWFYVNQNNWQPIISIELWCPRGSVPLSVALQRIHCDIPQPVPQSIRIRCVMCMRMILTRPFRIREITCTKPQATSRAIQTINNFKSQYKIKTNKQKFQVILISRRKIAQVTVDDTDYTRT